MEADNDSRLRRALLRQHHAIQYTYTAGQRVYYWRDAPGGAGPKIRWKGPATVIMTEPGRTGPSTNTYWITRGTTLLRVLGEHLRPDLNHSDTTDPIQRAKAALDSVRGRSTTLYFDLQRSNKRKRSEVLTEDEEDPEPAQEHTTQVEGTSTTPAIADPAATPTDYYRIHVEPRQRLFVPGNDAPKDQFLDARLTTIRRPNQPRTVLRDDWHAANADRGMPFHWTGSTTFKLRIESGTTMQTDATPQPMMVPESSSDTDMPSAHPAGATSNDAGTTTSPPALAPGDDAPMAPGTGDDPSIEAGTVPPQSAGEPEPPPSMPETPTVPSHQKELYTPATTETFQQRRARVDRQETLTNQPPAESDTDQTERCLTAHGQQAAHTPGPRHQIPKKPSR